MGRRRSGSGRWARIWRADSSCCSSPWRTRTISCAGPRCSADSRRTGESWTGRWTQFAERIIVHPFIALLGPIGFVCPFLVGLWAGPRRILENPARHRRLLTTTVVVGIGAAVLGAQPVSLVLARIILLADRMRRTGYRGPFELLIRRITYRTQPKLIARAS